MFKHHEYVNDLNYRSMTRNLYSDYTDYNRGKEIHEKLIKSSEEILPDKELSEKNSNVHSDIYNHVIGKTKNFPLDNILCTTESQSHQIFNFTLPFTSIHTFWIRVLATFVSLHDAILKHKKFNDPIIVLYDEPRDNYLVVTGQQRFFYAKIMGINLEAIVYSFGTSAAEKISKDIPDIYWLNHYTIKEKLFFNMTPRSEIFCHKGHAMLQQQHDKSRDNFMLDYHNTILNYPIEFKQHSEETYFYRDKLYVGFLQNDSAKKKIKVNVKDEYGIFQYMLWRYVGIDLSEFKMDKKFEIINEL